jgi:hypothetical protein
MRMHACFAFIIALCIIAVPACSAAEIADPENVTGMDTVVSQSGSIFLRGSSAHATAEDLTLRLFLPQNDSRQLSTITRVIGPDSFSIGYDSYGNAQVVLLWAKPRINVNLDYMVETAVRTDSGSSGQSHEFPVTEMVAADRDMIKAAYAALEGKDGAEGALLGAAWVNENTVYDISCDDQAYSAKWVFSEKRGTCDEFSSLLLSMLRATDYEAWYAAGYAYLGGRQVGESSFGSHAWVEARIDGQTYGIDPTWAESPLDATHITFARLPDANFTEHTSVRSRDVSIDWEKDETRIVITDYEESPRAALTISFMPDEVEGGKSAVLMAGLSSSGCMLTNARFASCVDTDGSDMLDMGVKSAAVAFCDEKEIYAVTGTPEIKRNMKYTCPVVFSAAGTLARSQLSITSQSSADATVAVATKRMLLAGEEFSVDVSLSGRGLPRQMQVYALLSGMLTQGTAHPGVEAARLSLVAPQREGEHVLTVVTQNGDSAQETIAVIHERSMRLTGIEYPSVLAAGGACRVTVFIQNAGDEGDAVVSFAVDGSKEDGDVDLPQDGNATISFNCTGLAAGSHAVSVSLLSIDGSYQDSWAGVIEASEEQSLKDTVAGSAEDFITWLLNLIKGIFGL